MLLPAPPLRLRKPRANPFRVPKAPPAPVAALNLIAAEYEESTWVQLTFDRAIDIAGMDATVITVNDGPLSGTLWEGDGTGMLIGPATVRIELAAFIVSASTETLLSAPATTGIVAVDDGTQWAGATDLTLPFP